MIMKVKKARSHFNCFINKLVFSESGLGSLGSGFGSLSFGSLETRSSSSCRTTFCW